MKKYKGLFLMIFASLGIVLMGGAHSSVSAQSAKTVNELNRRVTALEDYVDQLQGNIRDIPEVVEQNIALRISDVQDGFSDFAEGIQVNFNHKIKVDTRRIVVLDSASKEYRQISTNSGIFLISVNKILRTDNGYQLSLRVGNPNYATYQGIGLTLRWGKKLRGQDIDSFKQWRASLTSADFFYNGRIGKGSWTDVMVDLSPVTIDQLAYIECEMKLKAIEMGAK